MTNLLVPTEVDQAAAALHWLRCSLRQGEVISPVVLKFIEGRRGRTYTLAPESVEPSRLSDLEYGAIELSLVH